MENFYICLIVGINKNNYYFIWCQDYIITENNKLMFFYTLNDCVEYAKKMNINIADLNEIAVYDIKKIVSIFERRKLDYNELLNFINIIDDMHLSIGKQYKYLNNSEYFCKTDEKLLLSSTFLGCGKKFPLTSKEKTTIRKLIRTGLYFLNEQLSEI